MDAQRQLAAQQWIDLCCQIVYRSPQLSGEEKLAWKFVFRRSSGRAAQVTVQETEIAADQGAKKASAGALCLNGLTKKGWAELVEPVRNGHWHLSLVDPRVAAGPDRSRPLLPPPEDDDWDFGGMTASCHLVDDRVLQYVRRWPREGEVNKQGLRGPTKIAFEALWLRAGRRPGQILYSAHELGAAQGRRDAASSGRKLLKNLEEYGLAKVQDPVYWLIDVFSPVDVQTARLAIGSATATSHCALQQASLLPDLENRADAATSLSPASSVELGAPREALRVFVPVESEDATADDDSPHQDFTPAKPVATSPPPGDDGGTSGPRPSAKTPDLPPNSSRPSAPSLFFESASASSSFFSSASESADVREEDLGGTSGARPSAKPDLPPTTKSAGQVAGGDGSRDAADRRTVREGEGMTDEQLREKVDRAAFESQSQLGPVAFKHFVAAVMKGRLEPADKIREKLRCSQLIRQIVDCPFLYEWVPPLIADKIVEHPDKKLGSKIHKLLDKIATRRRQKQLKRPPSCLFVVTAMDIFKQEGLDWRIPAEYRERPRKERR